MKSGLRPHVLGPRHCHFHSLVDNSAQLRTNTASHSRERYHWRVASRAEVTPAVPRVQPTAAATPSARRIFKGYPGCGTCWDSRKEEGPWGQSWDSFNSFLPSFLPSLLPAFPPSFLPPSLPPPALPPFLPSFLPSSRKYALSTYSMRTSVLGI